MVGHRCITLQQPCTATPRGRCAMIVVDPGRPMAEELTVTQAMAMPFRLDRLRLRYLLSRNCKKASDESDREGPANPEPTGTCM